MKHINLGGNNVGDERARLINEALNENKVLKHIFFHGDAIEIAGAHAVSNALKHSFTLLAQTRWC